MENATSADSERSQCEYNGAQEELIERVGNTAAPTTGFTSEWQQLHSRTSVVLQHLAENTDLSDKQAPEKENAAVDERLFQHQPET
jgi:hypothetical protein